MAAKAMERVQHEVTIEFFSQPFLLSLSLPFSWKILFLAALVFLAANIMFALFCPVLIKETGSYSEFSEQKRSVAELSTQLKNQKLPQELRGRWINWFSGFIGNMFNQCGVAGFETERVERTLPEAYAEIIEALNVTKAFVRLFISTLYLTGLALFAYLIYQNSIFVFKHW